MRLSREHVLHKKVAEMYREVSLVSVVILAISGDRRTRAFGTVSQYLENSCVCHYCETG